MKVLVVGDIHLKPEIFDKAEKVFIQNHCDKTVFLGDFVDDWEQQNNIGLYNRTFDRLIEYINKNDSLICWGNHDMSYIWNKLETGFSYIARQTVYERITEVEKIMNGSYFSDKLTPDKAQYVHHINNLVFSHGGLMQSFIDDYMDYFLEASGKDKEMLTVDDIIKYINRMRCIPLWEDNSPLWARPSYNKYDHIYIPKDINGNKYLQIIGHTPMKEITDMKHYIMCDVFSTDDKGKYLGQPGFLIINSITKEYEIIKY